MLSLLLSLTLGSPSPEVHQMSYSVFNSEWHLSAVVSVAGHYHSDPQVYKYSRLLWPHKFSKYCRLSRLLRSGLWENDFEAMREAHLHMVDLKLTEMNPHEGDEGFVLSMARGINNWNLVRLLPPDIWAINIHTPLWRLK